MKGLSLVEGAHRRDFADVVWQIADKRGCDEVAIRYDCGHAIRADVWAPTLAKTREYGVGEAERRRFMQHSLFVMTREPGAPRVQITVPEGLCRLCARGQRQTLICGPLQMDLTDAPAAARRLELPLSSHAFLSVMGQVCRLPENLSTPPIPQGKDGSLKPFDGPPLPRESLRQWTRREVEDDLRAEVRRYVGMAMLALMLVGIQALYLCRVHLAPATSAFEGEGGENSSEPGMAGELGNLTSVGSFEMGLANSTWALSVLTVAVHKAFAPEATSVGPEDLVPGTHFFWSYLVHPLWMVTSVLLAPLMLVLDFVVVAVVRILFSLTRDLVWRPASWVITDLTKLTSGLVTMFVHNVIIRPTVVLSQIPMTNPMLVAMLLSLLVALVSAPQPPSLSLPSIWSKLPSFELTQSLKKAISRSKSLGPLVQQIKALWGMRKEGRAKGGRLGVPASRGSKGGSAGSRDRVVDSAPGRPEKAGACKQDGKTPGSSVQQQSAPPCFVCLDRPSRYILEPCSHRVVCGECAVQLVEAAARNRSMSEGAGGGGACPSCGMAISRAMRLFS